MTTSNEPHSDSEQPHDPMQEILHRQTRAIERLAKHFSPEEVAKEEKRWKKYLTRLAATITIVASTLIGSWQLLNFLKEKWDISNLAWQYAEVAKEIYYDEGNPQVALDFVGKALKLDEGNAKYWYLQAYIEGMAVVRTLMNLDRPLTKEEVDKAHQAIAHAVLLERASPNKPEPYILRGQVYAALNDLARARDQLSQAIQKDPNNDFAHVRLALLLAEEDHVDEALRELDVALQKNPNSKWAYLWRGVILADHKKDWDGAREAYGKALEKDPRFDLAYYNQAWTYVKQEPPDYPKARDLFEKALTISPDFKEAFYGMGMVYGYQNQYEIAAIYLGKALKIDEKFLTAWKWRGIVYAEQEKYDNALADFTKAIELAPSQPELYVRRARVYERTNKATEAISDLRYAAQIAPQDKKTWLYLGDVFTKVNELDQAMTYYEKAIAIDPKYSDVYIQIAQLWLKRGNTDKAKEAFDAAVSNASYAPERFLVPRGRFLMQQNAFDQALADFRAARDANANAAEAWLSEAEVLCAMKNKADGLTALNKYLEMKPTDKAAHELRDRLNAL